MCLRKASLEGKGGCGITKFKKIIPTVCLHKEISTLCALL